MNAYTPTSLSFVFQGLLLLGAILVLGLWIRSLPSRFWSRFWAWGLALASFPVALLICNQQPPGIRMLTIAGALLYAMKVIVVTEARYTENCQLSIPQFFSFCVLWFGMNPQVFGQKSERLSGGKELIVKGTIRVLLGLGLLIMAKWTASKYQAPWLAMIFALPGISLVIHFGFFSILAGFWRFRGIPCDALFKAPLCSTSLSEFWGKRWNLAFSEMTRIAVYGPFSTLLGKKWAALIAFLFSGLLHEFAISFPVRAGYGLPLIYFFIHGGLLQVERYLAKQHWAIGSNAWFGRLWVIFWLVLPLPLLFHPPFLKGVVWPLIDISK